MTATVDTSFICEIEGCNRGPATTGDIIHRTSPKGGPFRGRCDEHFEVRDKPLDEFLNIFREDNMRKKADRTFR